MARYDRGVAQRYASRKRKKRVAPARPLAAVGEPIDAATSVEDLDSDEDVADPVLRVPMRPAVRIARAPVVEQRRPPTRRAFSDYASEYRYVVGDLRRVLVVAGGLLLFLILLSFVLG
jgi:hypothetical protein